MHLCTENSFPAKPLRASPSSKGWMAGLMGEGGNNTVQLPRLVFLSTLLLEDGGLQLLEVF